MGECDMYERGGRGGCGDDNLRWRGTKKRGLYSNKTRIERHGLVWFGSVKLLQAGCGRAGKW